MDTLPDAVDTGVSDAWPHENEDPVSAPLSHHSPSSFRNLLSPQLASERINEDPTLAQVHVTEAVMTVEPYGEEAVVTIAPYTEEAVITVEAAVAAPTLVEVNRASGEEVAIRRVQEQTVRLEGEQATSLQTGQGSRGKKFRVSGGVPRLTHLQTIQSCSTSKTTKTTKTMLSQYHLTRTNRATIQA